MINTATIRPQSAPRPEPFRKCTPGLSMSPIVSPISPPTAAPMDTAMTMMARKMMPMVVRFVYRRAGRCRWKDAQSGWSGCLASANIGSRFASRIDRSNPARQRTGGRVAGYEFSVGRECIFPALAKLASLLGSSRRHAGSFHRIAHLVGSEVFDMCRKRPLVAKRIGHDSVAVAPEHVLCGHIDSGTGILRALDRGVTVLDIVNEVVASRSESPPSNTGDLRSRIVVGLLERVHL